MERPSLVIHNVILSLSLITAQEVVQIKTNVILLSVHEAVHNSVSDMWAAIIEGFLCFHLDCAQCC